MCRTFVPSLDTIHSVVLEKKLKMPQPIRGQDGHLGFCIASKSNNTCAGPCVEHLYLVWTQFIQWFLRSSKYEKLMTDDGRQTDAGQMLIRKAHLSFQNMKS